MVGPPQDIAQSRPDASLFPPNPDRSLFEDRDERVHDRACNSIDGMSLRVDRNKRGRHVPGRMNRPLRWRPEFVLKRGFRERPSKYI